MSLRHQGCCKAYMRDGGFFAFRRDEYPGLLDAWMGGRAFFSGMGVFGQPLTVKLGEVEGVCDFTPEAVRAEEDEAAAERAERLLNGDE